MAEPAARLQKIEWTPPRLPRQRSQGTATCTVCRQSMLIDISQVIDQKGFVCRACAGQPLPAAEVASPTPSATEEPPPAPPWAERLDHWLSGAPIGSPQISAWRQARLWCAAHRRLVAVAALSMALVLCTAVLALVAYINAALGLHDATAQCRTAQTAFSAMQGRWETSAAEALGQQQSAAAEKRTRLIAEAALRDSQRQCDDLRAQLGRAGQARLDAVRAARASIAKDLTESARRRVATEPLPALLIAAAAARISAEDGAPPDAALEAILRQAAGQVGPPALAVPSLGAQAMAVSSDGRWLTAGDKKRGLRLWDLASPGPEMAASDLTAAPTEVLSVAFDAQGRWLAVATAEPSVLLWDLSHPGPLPPPLTVSGSRVRMTAMSVSPQGRWLAICGADPGTDNCPVLLFDLAAASSAAPARVLRGHREQILAATFSTNERWLITAGEDKTVRVWDTQSAAPSETQIIWRGHEGWVDHLAVTHDGCWLASGSTDGTARLWRIKDPDPAAKAVVLRGRPSWITCMAMSLDDHWLATGHFDNTVQLWDLTAADPGAHAAVCSDHTDHVRRVTFTPDGRFLVSASQDKTIRLWNLAQPTFEPHTTLLGQQEDPIDHLAATADGRWIVTASDCAEKNDTATIRIWALGLNDLIESARLVATRHLPLGPRCAVIQEAAARGPLVR